MACTWFGGGKSEGVLRDELRGCGCGAIEDVLDAWQVVLYDPRPGQNTLWSHLLINARLGA